MLLVFHARVNKRVHDVDEKRYAADEQRIDDDDALDDRIIAEVNPLEQKPSDAGPGERRLGQDRAGEQGRELETEAWSRSE